MLHIKNVKKLSLHFLYLFCLIHFLFIDFINSKSQGLKFLIENSRKPNFNNNTDNLIIDDNLAIKKSFKNSDVITKNSFSIDLAKYFLLFASYGYCSEEQMMQNICCTDLINRENWRLEKTAKIDFDGYNMAVLSNNSTKKVIFTFPGTRSPLQFIKEALHQNGDALREDETQKILNYFNSVYNLIRERMQNIVKEMVEKYEDYQFIFTGHSLGGAVSSIIALDNVKYGKIKVSENNPVLITFGQPRTGNDIFANEIMKYIPVVFRVVRQGDFITKFPYCAPDMPYLNCRSVLPNFKFDHNITLTENQRIEESLNFYKWHVGGLKLFSDDMTDYKDCGYEYGDNHPDLTCDVSMSINIWNHVYYFGIKVSRYCKNNS